MAIIDGFCVDLDNSAGAGFRPGKTFTALMRASVDREGVDIWPTPYGEFGRDGGDGGGNPTAFATGAILIDCNELIHSDSMDGKGIREKRRSAKMRQTQWAQSLTIDERTVRRWESGETQPNRVNRKAISDWSTDSSR